MIYALYLKESTFQFFVLIRFQYELIHMAVVPPFKSKIGEIKFETLRQAIDYVNKWHGLHLTINHTHGINRFHYSSHILNQIDESIEVMDDLEISIITISDKDETDDPDDSDLISILGENIVTRKINHESMRSDASVKIGYLSRSIWFKCSRKRDTSSNATCLLCEKSIQDLAVHFENDCIVFH